MYYPIIILFSNVKRIATLNIISLLYYCLYGDHFFYKKVAGEHGAFRIAELLTSRGIHLDFLLDEGPGVLSGVIPGVSKPVGL